MLGNSITDAWGMGRVSRHSYLDRGISGQTTPQMVARFHQDAVDLHSSVVVILDGRADVIVTGDLDLLCLHSWRGIAILSLADSLAQGR